MTLSMLKEFVVLAECRNYTAAANRLFISQPTLSKHISAMEEELGLPLVERTRHATKLTEAGQRLLSAAQKITETYDAALSDLTHYSAGISGELTLGILFHDATNIVAPVIHALSKELPTIKITIQSHQPSTSMNALLAGSIDIADVFYTDDIAARRSLCFHSFCSESFSVLLPRDHPLAAREAVYLEDLNGEPFVWHRSDPPLTNYERKFLKAHKVRPSQEFYVDQVDALPLSVALHHAVSIVNRRASNLLNSNILVRDLADKDFRVNIAFAWKKSNSKPCLRPFVDALKQYTAAQAVQGVL